MLVGREVECAAIDGLLTEASGGLSRTLVLRGEPGIGKSALLSYAESKTRGWRVLRAAGTESEAELPFSALDQLLRPVCDRLALIPQPQAQALESALALAAPAPADRFSAAVGTLSLLAAVADEGLPVLCVVDDAHWLDFSSAAALVFACRRFKAERIGVLFAARDGERRQFVAPDLADLPVTALREEASRSLIGPAGVSLGRETMASVLEVAQGNPLALLELPSALSEAQRTGATGVTDPLPVTAKIEQAFLGRARTLPPDTQRALTVAAASDSDELATLLRALERLGLTGDALLPAETNGLVVLGKGRVSFRHPLVRSALYHAASPVDRRAAHRALAEAQATTEQRARRAWHLAEATISTDEPVAAELEAAGNDSRVRGAYASAAIAFERSAQLSTNRESRAGRLLAAGDVLWMAGQGMRATAILDDALTMAVDPTLRSDIEGLRARITIWSGSAVDASQRLRAAGERIATIDPSRAAVLMAEAALPSIVAGDLGLAVTSATRAMSLAEPLGGFPVVVAQMALGEVLALRGESARARELLNRVRAALDKNDPFGPGAILTQIASCLLWLEDYEAVQEILGGVIGAARTRGAVVVLPFALGVQSDYEGRRGNFAAAYAAASESVALAHETGQDAEATFSYAGLARSEAVLGRSDECRAHAQRASELSDLVAAAVVKLYALSAVGLLELGLGRPEIAIESLLPLARAARVYGLEEPATVQWAPDLIEVLVELGREPEARAALETFSAQAERTERNWALSTAARCRGLLAAREEMSIEFERALLLHDRTPTPFERARTEFAYGRRLRRAGLRRKSRGLLHSAFATFKQLGATPWAERAAAELRASGEAVRERQQGVDERLTAQELQVALIVAEGATNREAAARLFLSPKTIEFHLSNIFRKLKLRSRTELARRLADSGGFG